MATSKDVKLVCGGFTQGQVLCFNLSQSKTYSMTIIVQFLVLLNQNHTV